MKRRDSEQGHVNWADLRAEIRGPNAEEVYQDEARIYAFREFVYQLRTDAGLSQEELAQRMGITEAQVERMEDGGVRPSAGLRRAVVSASQAVMRLATDAHPVTLDAGRRLVLPQEICERLGLAAGTPLVLVETNEGVLILTREQAKARVRASLAGQDLVGDLLAERRAAAALENQESSPSERTESGGSAVGPKMTPEEEYEFYSRPENQVPRGPGRRRKRSRSIPDLVVDFKGMTDDRHLITRVADARPGYSPVVGECCVVGDIDAEHRVARILSVDEDGLIDLEVLPDSGEAE